MSGRRKFNFPLATLTRSAELLGSALTDPAHQAAMSASASLPAGDDDAFLRSEKLRDKPPAKP